MARILKFRKIFVNFPGNAFTFRRKIRQNNIINGNDLCQINKKWHQEIEVKWSELQINQLFRYEITRKAKRWYIRPWGNGVLPLFQIQK